MNRLSEYDTVTLNLPAGDLRMTDFDCTVIALRGSTAALEPTDFAITSLPGAIEDVLLSFVHDGMLVGLKGTLVGERGGTGLRFSVQDGVHVHRQRATRVDVELPAILRRAGSTDSQPCVTLNLAADGVLLASDVEAKTGDLFALSLTLPAPWPRAATRGRVVRQAAGRIALQFLREQRDSRRMIEDFVVAHQLAALHTR